MLRLVRNLALMAAVTNGTAGIGADLLVIRDPDARDTWASREARA
jgi:hypothetical protein